MTTAHGARASNRDALLDALEHIISEGSVHGVTLDGVAARAGITKGGLIYHFKSKEMLLHALVERMRMRLDAHCVDPDMSPRLALRKFLIARIHYAFALSAQEKKVMANLLAAASSYPALMAPVKAMYEGGIEGLARVEGTAGMALSVWTALDGFVLLEMLGVRHFSATEKEQMKANLLLQVEQGIGLED